MMNLQHASRLRHRWRCQALRLQPRIEEEPIGLVDPHVDHHRLRDLDGHCSGLIAIAAAARGF